MSSDDQLPVTTGLRNEALLSQVTCVALPEG